MNDVSLDDVEPIPQPRFEWKGPPRGPVSRLDGDGEVYAAASEYRRSLEKLVGPNNLRPISFLERGLQLAGPVAHIFLPGVGTGTGFLVAPDVLLTNHHVLDAASTAAEAIVRFNYQDALDGTELPARRVRTVPRDGFFTSPHRDGAIDADHLDISVVRLAEPVGDAFGVLTLAADVPVSPRTDVVIIQHPAGQKKQIALADNELVYADDVACQYLTDTLSGSSGAPVFNDRWQLVAVHHAGGAQVQPGDPQAHLRNEGVRASAVLPALPDWVWG